MQLKVKEAFKFAHHGVRVVEYAKGETIDTEALGFDEELIEIARREKWVESAKPPTKAEKEARIKELEAEKARLEGEMVDADDATLPQLEAALADINAELLKLA